LFLAGLEAAFRRDEPRFFGALAPLAEPDAFAERVRSLRSGEWIVYAKPPFGGPSRALAYLARYAHRAAIANSRLVAVTDDEVAFSYKDHRRDGRRKIMRLGAHEFIRRFLSHASPDGFHRIRHHGFLAKGDRGQKLERVRALLAAQSTGDQTDAPRATKSGDEPARRRHSGAAGLCWDCGGPMRRLGRVAPIRPNPFRCDAS
jgi:hypothetical protein